MVVCLSQRRAVSRKDLLALAVRRENGLIGLRCGVFKPREQRRANIEADPGIVVDDLDDATLAVQNPGGGVGCVAFGGDPLVVADDDHWSPRQSEAFHVPTWGREVNFVPD